MILQHQWQQPVWLPSGWKARGNAHVSVFDENDLVPYGAVLLVTNFSWAVCAHISNQPKKVAMMRCWPPLVWQMLGCSNLCISFFNLLDGTGPDSSQHSSVPGSLNNIWKSHLAICLILTSDTHTHSLSLSDTHTHLHAHTCWCTRAHTDPHTHT